MIYIVLGLSTGTLIGMFIISISDKKQIRDLERIAYWYHELAHYYKSELEKLKKK